MITDNLRNLFQFIDFLHENIENFNQYENDAIDWIYSRFRIDHVEDHYKDRLELSDYIELEETKFDILYENIYYPIEKKAMELNIYSFEGYVDSDKLHYQEILDLSCSDLKNDAIDLINCFDEEDEEEILEAKRQYIEFRCESKSFKVELMVLKKMDEIMTPILDNFSEEDDKELPEIESFFIGGYFYSKEYFKSDSYFESYNHINNDNIDKIDTKTIIDLITVFTEAVYFRTYHKRNIKVLLLLDEMERFYFTVSGKVKNVLTYYFLEGDIDFLRRTKKILQKGLSKWKDVYDKEGYYIDVRVEKYESIKNDISDNEMKDLAEMKLLYINSLIETIDELLNSTTEKNDKTTQDKQTENNTILIEAKENTPKSYTPKPSKFNGKHYALAFIYDCLATDVDYMEFDGKKSQLEAIGESRVNGSISGNTFYKAFNEIMAAKTDIESEKGLINLVGENWRKIIIKLSSNPEKVSEYLKEMGL